MVEVVEDLAEVELTHCYHFLHGRQTVAHRPLVPKLEAYRAFLRYELPRNYLNTSSIDHARPVFRLKSFKASKRSRCDASWFSSPQSHSCRVSESRLSFACVNSACSHFRVEVVLATGIPFVNMDALASVEANPHRLLAAHLYQHLHGPLVQLDEFDFPRAFQPQQLRVKLRFSLCFTMDPSYKKSHPKPSRAKTFLKLR